MLITKVPTTTTAPRPTHLESSSCSGHIIDNASDNDADDYASFLSSLWQNAFLCYPQKQEDRIRSILRAGRSQTTTRGATTTTITASLTSAAVAAAQAGITQKKQVQFSKQQRVRLFRLKEPPMNVKFAHVVLSVAHQAAPFAARVLDQMITDIVAHGPEVAQELAIDSFQCELDRFTRVAYPPLSPEGNCSLALSMHHLPQCFGTRH